MFVSVSTRRILSLQECGAVDFVFCIFSVSTRRILYFVYAAFFLKNTRERKGKKYRYWRSTTLEC